MPEEHSLEGVPPRQDSNGRSGRPEFVQFRSRIQRLVESLVGLRNSSAAAQDWREQERVEVKLESAAVIVEFFVAKLSWETANELAHHFQSSFAQFAPVFLDAPAPRIFKLGKSREKEGSYRQLHILEDTSLMLQWDPLNAGYSVKIQTNLNDFNDHFEVFVTDAARKPLPATGRRAKEHVVDLESWYKEFGRAFEKMGCRVLRECAMRWKDLAGLDYKRK